MEVRIKKLSDFASMPKKAHESDAGFDLVATTKTFDENGNVVYGTGLAFEIPEGYVGLLFPRSSNAKKDLLLSNSVGVIDSCYRGEVLFKFKTTQLQGKIYKTYEIGERIGQLIILPYPNIEFVKVKELSDTERGCGGYGSSGV